MSDLFLPVVIRKGPRDFHRPSLTLAAQAMGKFWVETQTNAEWSDVVDKWADERSAKIVRRASGKKWDKVKEESAVSLETEHAGISIFLPSDRSSLSPLVSKLPIKGTDYNKMFYPHQSVTVDVPVLLLAENPDLNLSTGKMVAQVGHAIQYLYQDDPLRVKSWVETGAHTKFTAWRDILVDTSTVIVTDNGRTEVSSGTHTVKARLESTDV